MVEMTIKSKKHYVNNTDFCSALTTYKKKVEECEKANLPKPLIPNYIGECFIKIAEGLSHNRNFINYPFRDEMISDGIENCVMYFENFNETKSSNAFSYFTQIIYYAFLRRIQKEKKQLYVKYKSTQQFGILEENEILGYEEATGRQFEMYDNISEFIDLYEKTKKKKLETKKLKGIEKFMEE